MDDAAVGQRRQELIVQLLQAWTIVFLPTAPRRSPFRENACPCQAACDRRCCESAPPGTSCTGEQAAASAAEEKRSCRNRQPKCVNMISEGVLERRWAVRAGARLLLFSLKDRQQGKVSRQEFPRRSLVSVCAPVVCLSVGPAPSAAMLALVAGGVEASKARWGASSVAADEPWWEKRE